MREIEYTNASQAIVCIKECFGVEWVCCLFVRGSSYVEKRRFVYNIFSIPSPHAFAQFSCDILHTTFNKERGEKDKLGLLKDFFESFSRFIPKALLPLATTTTPKPRQENCIRKEHLRSFDDGLKLS